MLFTRILIELFLLKEFGNVVFHFYLLAYFHVQKMKPNLKRRKKKQNPTLIQIYKGIN